ncbi:outer membrane lipoprotein chaperone LolA [Methylomonas sp. MED-D]|uniref:outer membrane lipoprotein chaperone LolA n=1 Tax=unclassified Methylomonas TaxID=2608980 RepID=UPI0008DA0A71|nr:MULTISPECIES: outer membrane lipoprotein chaperone LolA [unclassified Methylomonas]MDT4331413.1 outer membrane lipoprotein chaperone LolA [Methylomonas sp. MV1]OHX36118.1 outer membrane lipoprotein carrier protein LolA [Methylomonas sp. LWB]
MKILSFVFCLICATPLHAEETPIARLKTFLAGSSALAADFRQVTLDKSGKPAQTSSGKFYLSRPGKFRWNYQKPFVQEIVSNGGKVWFYDADLEQVTVKQLDDSLGSTPALLLTGQIDIEEKFTLREQGEDEGMNWVKLSPKNEESGFKYILIGLERDQLGGMELSDNFGQLTRIYFSNIQINPKLEEALFNFKAPKGADVFEN